jgi:hypothetical protein
MQELPNFDNGANELSIKSGPMNDRFLVVVRRMLEQSMLVFLRVIAQYLNECSNKDRLLVIALEHLIHLLLFGDELCLEAIRVSLLGESQIPLKKHEN